MATIKIFEEITSWQAARKLTKLIYELSNEGPLVNDYGFKDQMRRSTVSIMANIAEGYGRRSDKEFIQYLSIAHGSVEEFKSHLYVAHDNKYIEKDDFEKLYKLADEIKNQLGGFIKYLSKQNTKEKRPKAKKRITARPGTKNN